MGKGDDDSFTVRPFEGDMKRDLASMIRELQNTAEDARAQIGRAVVQSTKQLEAAAAFWAQAEAGAEDFPEFLMRADHVVTLRMHLPRAERVQIGIHAWGSGPQADLYATTEGDYDVLVVFQRRKR